MFWRVPLYWFLDVKWTEISVWMNKHCGTVFWKLLYSCSRFIVMGIVTITISPQTSNVGHNIMPSLTFAITAGPGQSNTNRFRRPLTDCRTNSCSVQYNVIIIQHMKGLDVKDDRHFVSGDRGRLRQMYWDVINIICIPDFKTGHLKYKQIHKLSSSFCF